MNTKKVEQLAVSTARPESTSNACGKRWHFGSAVLLMLLGASAVILYLLRSVLAAPYEGFGAALCVVACGGFLVWQVIRLFAEQDQLEEKELTANQAKTSTPELNPIELQTNLTTPRVETEKE